MFIDASAIVAILTSEPEADAFSDLLDSADAPITSAIAIFEAVLGLCGKRRASVSQAAADVREFLETATVATVAITDREAETALRAFAGYGKGRGHQAQLNLGDCFAYAMAKNHGRALCSRATTLQKPISGRRRADLTRAGRR